MTMRGWKAGAVLTATVATVGGGVAGDDAPRPRKAKLEFRVVATWAGGETHGIGSFGMGPLEEGGAMSAGLQMRGAAGDSEPCNSSVTMSVSLPARPEGPLPLWHVEGRLRSAEMDDILVEYAWKRWSGAGTGSSPDASGRAEARLSEGGHRLLDFVPVFEASSGCWNNVALELAASIPEPEEFKDRRIGYDLWLVSEGYGRRQTRRLQLIGKQGEKVAFDYGALRSMLPAAPRASLLETTVDGSIRSRVQSDGSIEILLTASRGAHPLDRTWYAGARGSKKVQATPGETLRLELPPPAAPDRVDDPATFRALAEQHVSLVLTPTLVD
jgi:hypothetical protein